MAKVAKKAQETAAMDKAGLPPGVKIAGGKDETPLDAASIRLVMQGWEAKKRIDDLKAELDGINARLIEAHGTGCALVVSGVCRASLTERQTVKVTDPERLETVLGGRFIDLVRESVSYQAEPKLIEMATDADDPLQPSVAACLTVSTSTSVAWRAEK